MGAPQYEQAGADISGSGTTNTIPRWTGPTTLGDSLLSQSGTVITSAGTGLTFTNAQAWTLAASTSALSIQSGLLSLDTTNSRVSIKTTLAGAGYQSGFSMTDAATTTLGFGLQNVGGTSQPFIYGNTALGFGTNLANRMVIDGSGNVGIGTASPSVRLHVLNNSANALARFESSIANGAYALWHNGTNTTLFAGFGSTLDSAATVDDAVLRYQASKVLIISRGGSEAARFDSNGNIYGTSGTTGMTNGFFYIPAAAGAPTGTPTAVSGRVPMYYDTTNNKFYIYNGAWKQVALT